jgi:hypothetical protein
LAFRSRAALFLVAAVVGPLLRPISVAAQQPPPPPCVGFALPAFFGPYVQGAFSSGANITPAGATNGEEVLVGLTVSAETTSAAAVTIELRGGADELVYARSFPPYEHNRDTGGLGRNLFDRWRVPGDLPAGTYRLVIMVLSPDGSRELHRSDYAASVAVIPPAPSDGPAPLAFADHTHDPRAAFEFSARGQAYELVAFEKGCPNALVRVYRDPPGRTGMVFEVPGVPLSKWVSGAAATAVFDDANPQRVQRVEWLSYRDRLTQVIVLGARPPDDRVVTTVRGSAVAWGPSERGYVVQTSGGYALYEMLTPEAVDADGRPGAAALVLINPENASSPAQAVVSLDSEFAASAAYPVQVRLTTRYHWFP